MADKVQLAGLSTDHIRSKLESGEWVLYERNIYTQEAFIELCKLMDEEEYFNLLQTVIKLALNSSYGALLNLFSRFNDHRLGASTTASGRTVTTHIMRMVGRFCNGEDAILTKHTTVKLKEEEDGGGDDEDPYQNPDMCVIEKKSEYTTPHPFIIYGDTDSCAFKIPMKEGDTLEDAVVTADRIAGQVNGTFEEFTKDAFLASGMHTKRLKVAREIVGKSAIFVRKKMYIVALYDKDGKRVKKGDKAYYKIMGLTMKKSDTPKPIRTFLTTVFDMVLDGVPPRELDAYILDMRAKVMGDLSNLWSIGINKQVNAIGKYQAAYDTPGLRNESGRKIVIPGHVRAALNYNHYCLSNGIQSKLINSGDKVFTYYLRPNAYGWETIAFPLEAGRFPEWFTDNFQIDRKRSEEMLFDSKLSGLFQAIERTIPDVQTAHVDDLFEF